MLTPSIAAPTISSTFLPTFLRHPSSRPLPKQSISAALPPSSSSSSSPSPSPFAQQQQQLYQPFRPPPSPLPSDLRSLDALGRLEVLSQRLGLWFHYAPLIPSLYREGFTPPSIEDATGISGVEQNRLLVAAQVRDSLLQSRLDPQTLSFFDTGGAEILYELRLLSAAQRLAAASYAAAHRLDVKASQELARAIKDFPRRKWDPKWGSFDCALPGDCLAFMHFRQSREHPNPSPQRTAALESALQAAESPGARAAVVEELEGKSREGGDGSEPGQTEMRVTVPVVRMKVGEVAEATAVVVLPLCRAEEVEKELAEAPWECRSEGEFGAVVADKGWRRWMVLPGWEPVAGIASGGGGIVVSFVDARALPWKVKRWYKEEPILVVADRGRKEVGADDGFYLVSLSGENGAAGGLKVERGSVLKGRGVEESLGTVVLVVRPPKEEVDDQLSDEDWE